MRKINDSDYLHLTRVKYITAKEAQRFLATFALRNKKFKNNDEFQSAFNKELRLAYAVVSTIMHYNPKISSYEPPLCDFDEFGNIIGYDLESSIIQVEGFCRWALEKNYDLPDILKELIDRAEVPSLVQKNHSISTSTNDATDKNSSSEPEASSKKGGKPKGYLLAGRAL